MTEYIQKLRCLRCGHEWFPRSGRKPITCPNKKCRSPYWDKERGWRDKSKITKEKEKELQRQFQADSEREAEWMRRSGQW